MRVLVLDDHRYMCEVIAKNLQSADLDVDAATCFDDACMYLMSDSVYSAGVFDIALDNDKKDGINFSKEFKKKFPKASIHIVTGVADKPKELKYNTYQQKPNIDYDLIIDYIKGNTMNNDTRLIRISDTVDEIRIKVDNIENLQIEDRIKIENNEKSINAISNNCVEQRRMQKDTLKWLIGIAIVIIGAVIGDNRLTTKEIIKDSKDRIEYEIKKQISKMDDVSLSRLRKLEEENK